ncbi:MAG TPA: hypothetical protein VHE81_08035, partial [Lacipirellulaceae bacterium]|nr:hypothetical protein [Lacipirellulaceae bacterium]
MDSVVPTPTIQPKRLPSVDQQAEPTSNATYRPDDRAAPGQKDVDQPDASKKADASARDESGYVVGSDLSVKSDFRNGLFLWFATPNNDFTMHIGGWAQLDNVWWDQSQALKASPGARPGHAQGVASGAPAGGIGELSDGEYFRRVRLFFEGTFWENGEYRLIPALENDQFSTVGLD